MDFHRPSTIEEGLGVVSQQQTMDVDLTRQIEARVSAVTLTNP